MLPTFYARPIVRIVVPLTLFGLLAACGGSTSGPCAQYCDYICGCPSADTGVTCADCSTIYTDGDPSLQNECQTSLTDLQNADAAAGVDCSTDTATQ